MGGGADLVWVVWMVVCHEVVQVIAHTHAGQLSVDSTALHSMRSCGSVHMRLARPGKGLLVGAGLIAVPTLPQKPHVKITDREPSLRAETVVEVGRAACGNQQKSTLLAGRLQKWKQIPGSAAEGFYAIADGAQAYTRRKVVSLAGALE